MTSSATLSGKYGPAADEPPGDPEARLNAYERVVRAAADARGPPRPPVLYLGDEQLAALFAPRLLDALVTRPLGRGLAECPPAPPGADG